MKYVLKRQVSTIKSQNKFTMKNYFYLILSMFSLNILYAQNNNIQKQIENFDLNKWNSIAKSNGNGIPDYLEPNNHMPSDDDLEIFNLVTPNGDGDNDVFVIRNIERYPENSVEIYNRWGVKVFDVNGYGQNQRYFRGISEGRATVNQDSELPVGTYWYIIKYKNAQGNWKQRVGYLYLNK